MGKPLTTSQPIRQTPGARGARPKTPLQESNANSGTRKTLNKSQSNTSTTTRQTSLHTVWKLTQKWQTGQDPDLSRAQVYSNSQVGENLNDSGQDAISFSSLNVENLIAKLNEPDFVSYIKSFDIFCTLKAFTGSHFDFSTYFQDYSVFHAPAEKLSRQGRKSDGVALLIRKVLMQYVTYIECCYDNMICFKLAKDRLCIDRDLLFVSQYVPPYQNAYYKQCDTNCSIHHLENFLLDLCPKRRQLLHNGGWWLECTYWWLKTHSWWY